MAADDLDYYDLMSCFGRSDSPAYQIATMLLAELNAGGIMGELYVESLTQAPIVHLLRYYTRLPPRIVYLVWASPNRPVLSPTRLQQAIDYIHTHLDCDLSMTQIASSVNTSPTYFASLFKRATGMSLHQYVIEQRVAQAKLLLETTDLPIANIASQVGFSSQSHLTRHCKQLTGMRSSPPISPSLWIQSEKIMLTSCTSLKILSITSGRLRQRHRSRVPIKRRFYAGGTPA